MFGRSLEKTCFGMKIIPSCLLQHWSLVLRLDKTTRSQGRICFSSLGKPAPHQSLADGPRGNSRSWRLRETFHCKFSFVGAPISRRKPLQDECAAGFIAFINKRSLIQIVSQSSTTKRLRGPRSVSWSIPFLMFQQVTLRVPASS